MPLTEIQRKHGPFAVAAAFKDMTHMTTCDADSRLALVKQSTDVDWLQAVIRDRDVQASVRLAAERRQRWVNKAVKGLIANYKARVKS